MTAVRLNQGEGPLRVKLGDYTLELSYVGRGRVPIAPEPPRATQPAAQQGQASSPAPPAAGIPSESPPTAAMQAAAILVANGSNEFFFCGGGFRIAFSPNTPGPAIAGLGLVQEGKFINGKWVVTRQLGGDDIGQGEILTLRPNTLLRVLVYRYE